MANENNKTHSPDGTIEHFDGRGRLIGKSRKCRTGSGKTYYRHYDADGAEIGWDATPESFFDFCPAGGRPAPAQESRPSDDRTAWGLPYEPFPQKNSGGSKPGVVKGVVFGSIFGPTIFRWLFAVFFVVILLAAVFDSPIRNNYDSLIFPAMLVGLPVLFFIWILLNGKTVQAEPFKPVLFIALTSSAAMILFVLLMEVIVRRNGNLEFSSDSVILSILSIFLIPFLFFSLAMLPHLLAMFVTCRIAKGAGSYDQFSRLYVLAKTWVGRLFQFMTAIFAVNFFLHDFIWTNNGELGLLIASVVIFVPSLLLCRAVLFRLMKSLFIRFMTAKK